MIRDITIGQYYPAQSPIHRLDPRVKIVCTLLYLISLFGFFICAEQCAWICIGICISCVHDSHF